MHPLIQEFWEKLGYRLYFEQSRGIWTASRPGESDTIDVAYRSFLTTFNSKHPDFYIWDSKYVSEEHMLKIIKMKAFV